MWHGVAQINALCTNSSVWTLSSVTISLMQRNIASNQRKPAASLQLIVATLVISVWRAVWRNNGTLANLAVSAAPVSMA